MRLELANAFHGCLGPVVCVDIDRTIRTRAQILVDVEGVLPLQHARTIFRQLSVPSPFYTTYMDTQMGDGPEANGRENYERSADASRSASPLVAQKRRQAPQRLILLSDPSSSGQENPARRSRDRASLANSSPSCRHPLRPFLQPHYQSSQCRDCQQSLMQHLPPTLSMLSVLRLGPVDGHNKHTSIALCTPVSL